MINESARLLREVQEMKTKLDFKYIIVDEYQDISRQRFDLTKVLYDHPDFKKEFHNALSRKYSNYAELYNLLKPVLKKIGC